MNLSNASKFLAITLLTTISFSCSQSDKNALKETQLCLNDTPASQARACLTKIAGDVSEEAYKLRCSAIFISEGFGNISSFTDAINKINNSSGSCTGGCSPTVSAVSTLSFKNTNNALASEWDRTNALANEALSNCTLSKTNAYIQIASFFKIGTNTANLVYLNVGGGATVDENAVKGQLTNLDPTDLGNLATTVYSATCQNLTGASDSTKKYCAELGVAVNKGGGAAAIGLCLKQNLETPSTCT